MIYEKKNIVNNIRNSCSRSWYIGLYSKNKNSPVARSLSSHPEKRAIALTENPMQEQKMESNEVKHKSVKDKPITITFDEIRTLHENFPDKRKVNEEVKQPHHTPSKTLMTFAKRLGPLMEKAFKNEKDANIIVKELSDCANDESVAKAARAMCVTNTERLARVHPKIEKMSIDLRARVSPEVQKILDTNDSFIKKSQ